MQPLLQWKSNKYYILWVCVYVCVCVFVALGIQHAMHMHHIVMCGLPGSKIFFHIISQTAWFLKIFWFSLQLLSETFLILRWIEWDKSSTENTVHILHLSWDLSFLLAELKLASLTCTRLKMKFKSHASFHLSVTEEMFP